MNRLPKLLAGMAFALFAVPALAALNVFATMPEWAALTEELGGDKVKIYTATNALQDAHHVEAKPSLIARARSADLVVATGAELEIGWLPLVTQQAGNPEDPAGQARLFRGDGVRDAARKADAPRPCRGRCPRRGQSAHPDRSAQYRSRGWPARDAARRSRPRKCCLLPGALQGVRRALERGHRELGKAGGAIARHVDSSSSTRRSLISRSGWGSTKSPHSNPSPASSRRPRTSPKSWRRCIGSRSRW